MAARPMWMMPLLVGELNIVSGALSAVQQPPEQLIVLLQSDVM